MSKQEIATMVRRYLDGQRLGDIYFVVDEAHIQTGDNWWRVPVRPSRLPRKLFTFYELLAETAEEIAEHEKRNIILMSGEPLFEDEELVPAASEAS